MAFNIQSFKAGLSNIARPTLFTLSLNSIPSVPYWPAGLLDLTCKGTQLPSYTTGKIPVPYMGRKVNFPGDVDYQDWQITVICDREMNIWRGLHSWRQAWNASVGNISDSTGNVHVQYKTDAYLFTYDNAGNKVLKVTIVGLHPIDVPAIELSWENNDSTMDLQCTFMIDYFYVDSANNAGELTQPGAKFRPVANHGVPANSNPNPPIYTEKSGVSVATNNWTGFNNAV